MDKRISGELTASIRPVTVCYDYPLTSLLPFFSLWKTPDISGSSDSQLVQSSSKLSLDVQSTPALPPSLGTKSSLRLASMRFEMQSDPVTEVRDLKEQLEALRCQVSSRVIKIFNVITKVEL